MTSTCFHKVHSCRHTYKQNDVHMVSWTNQVQIHTYIQLGFITHEMIQKQSITMTLNLLAWSRRVSDRLAVPQTRAVVQTQIGSNGL